MMPHVAPTRSRNSSSRQSSTTWRHKWEAWDTGRPTLTRIASRRVPSVGPCSAACTKQSKLLPLSVPCVPPTPSNNSSTLQHHPMTIAVPASPDMVETRTTTETPTSKRVTARLVGKTPDTALYGSRLWDVYYEKMTPNEKHTLSSVIHMTRKLGKMPCLRDAMAVIDEDNLNSGSSTTSSSKAAVVPVVAPTSSAAAGSATSLAPGPMELGAVNATQRSSGQCARCKGYGHWSTVCPSSRNWKWGDPVAGKPSTSSGPSSGATRAKSRTAKGSQAYNTEVDQDSEGLDEEEEDDDKAESESGKA